MHHALDVVLPLLGLEIGELERRIVIGAEASLTVTAHEAPFAPDAAILHAMDGTAVRAYEALGEGLHGSIVRNVTSLSVRNRVHDKGTEIFKLNGSEAHEVFGAKSD